MLEKYKDATGGQHLKIQDIWRVERDGEVRQKILNKLLQIAAITAHTIFLAEHVFCRLIDLTLTKI